MPENLVIDFDAEKKARIPDRSTILAKSVCAKCEYCILDEDDPEEGSTCAISQPVYQIQHPVTGVFQPAIAIDNDPRQGFTMLDNGYNEDRILLPCIDKNTNGKCGDYNEKK